MTHHIFIMSYLKTGKHSLLEEVIPGEDTSRGVKFLGLLLAAGSVCSHIGGCLPQAVHGDIPTPLLDDDTRHRGPSVAAKGPVVDRAAAVQKQLPSTGAAGTAREMPSSARCRV